jgi:hypothetical protein
MPYPGRGLMGRHRGLALLNMLANLQASATVSERNRPLTPRIIT